MSTKKAFKSIKSHIENKDQEAALYEATELLKSLDPKSPDAAQTLVYRGLALFQLDRKEEAEKSYLHAYRIQPSNPLASLGVRKLYQKISAWEKLGRFLETLVQEAYDQGDADHCASALQDLVQLRLQHGHEDGLYAALRLLLPASPLVPLLQTVAPLPGAYEPFPQPSYPPASVDKHPELPKTLPHVLHLVSSLPLLLHLLVRAQVQVHVYTEAEVKKGRQRLGGGKSEKEVRKTVDGDVLSGSLGAELLELLREVGSHPNVDDSIRREVEIKEFGFWRRLVTVLPSEDANQAKKQTKPTSGKAKAEPSPTDTKELPVPPLLEPVVGTNPTKAEALAKTNSLAEGFVLLNVSSPGAEDGWSWIIEGKEESTIFYDLELLHKFAKTFPESALTDFIDDYCRWFHLPLPEPEDDAAPVPENQTPVINESEKKAASKKKWRRGRSGLNAKERRKARRLAGKDGVLNEDLDQEERDELVAGMTKLLDKLPKSIFAHRVMARISIQEEDWANAVSFAEKGRVLLKELETERGISLASVKASLDTALGVALVPYFPPKHHTRAARLLNGVLQTEATNVEARFARAQIFQTAQNWSEARRSFQMILDLGGDEKEMVAAREELAWCFVNEGRLEKGREILEEVVEMRDSRWEQSGKEDEALPRARAWYRLGRTEWMIGDDESKQHAEDWFMASIRALPSFAPAYSSLGTCYISASNPDTDRAMKCFQKAFELDATEADAARLLAEGYADDDEWARVRTIAMRVMEGEGGVEGVAGGEVMNAKGRFAPKNGWAWKALGSTEMHYKNYAKAAQAYQIALRADPDDASTWVLLGESYVRCGRHTAGLKTLQHALELDPNNWMGLYDIGDVYTQIGSFELAIEAFQGVLATMQKVGTEEDLGVIARLAEAELSLGRKNAAGGFKERSRRAFHNAITYAGDVLRKGQGHRPWAWKVVGDSAFELATQESNQADIEETAQVINPILELLVQDDTDKRATVEGLGHPSTLVQSSAPDDQLTIKTSVFAFAYRVYLLKNQPRVADPALYDLASALHALAKRLKGPDDESSRKACMKAAIGAVRMALERDAGDERLWNALGVIAMDGGEEVAQHAFVVSLELYGKDPVVWTNLGYLYLKLEDLELAYQCFLKAQIIDPDYARAWLGQGLVCDKKGEKDQAKALFAHSVTLSAGSLLEADLAQAITAFLPLISSSKVDTALLHAPAFALRHYTHQRPREIPALHLYTLICERLGLVEEAAAALEKAANLLEEAFESSESEEIERAYSVALVNLGRVRLASGHYAQALEAFTNCWELVSSATEDTNLLYRLKVQSRLGQALAHFWLEDVDKSLEAFQSALEEGEAQQGTGKLKGYKEEVAVLLARTLWGVGGEDAKEAAKTHLLECLSQDTPPIKVISTLAAVALVSSDDDLLEASISELHSLSAPRILAEDTRGTVASVLAAHALVEGDLDGAIQELEKPTLASATDILSRNKLAKMLIVAGRAEEALSILLVDEPDRDFSQELDNTGARKLAGVAGQVGVATRSETLRLKGIAKILNADESGVSELMASVRVCPWNEENWEAVAWGKRILSEVQS